jgi:hypothetical protein
MKRHARLVPHSDYFPGSRPVPLSANRSTRRSEPTAPAPSRVGPTIDWREASEFVGRDVVMYGIVRYQGLPDQPTATLAFVNPTDTFGPFPPVRIVVVGRKGLGTFADGLGWWDGRGVGVSGRVRRLAGSLVLEIGGPQAIRPMRSLQARLVGKRPSSGTAPA